MKDVVRIPLTQGLYALIDRQDATAVKAFKWNAQVCKSRKKTPYACKTVIHPNGHRQTLMMHRFLWDLWGMPPAPEIDHVSWVSGNGWTAHIAINKRTRYLGHFNSPEAAARVYDRWAREVYGEFAYINFPGDL